MPTQWSLPHYPNGCSKLSPPPSPSRQSGVHGSSTSDAEIPSTARFMSPPARSDPRAAAQPGTITQNTRGQSEQGQKSPENTWLTWGLLLNLLSSLDGPQATCFCALTGEGS